MKSPMDFGLAFDDEFSVFQLVYHVVSTPLNISEIKN